uniref:WWE domain-containing protein n=1 Tax=Arcella intermedia TaxID=1963864 RepID=A0A6B2KWC7_9EUKA
MTDIRTDSPPRPANPLPKKLKFVKSQSVEEKIHLLKGQLKSPENERKKEIISRSTKPRSNSPSSTAATSPAYKKKVSLSESNKKKGKKDDLEQQVYHLTHMKEVIEHFTEKELLDFKEQAKKIVGVGNEELQYSNKQLKELSITSQDIFNCIGLYLSENEFSVFPAPVLQCFFLEVLDLSSNQIASIPAEIKHLRFLKDLRISNNRLFFNPLPAEITLLPLHTLLLSQNSLESLVPQFTALKSLTLLDVSKNEFKKIPDELFQLNQLKSLNFSNNKITEIPDTISLLSSLESFDISSNFINKFNSNVFNIKTLKILKITQNQVKVVSPQNPLKKSDGTPSLEDLSGDEVKSETRPISTEITRKRSRKKSQEQGARELRNLRNSHPRKSRDLDVPGIIKTKPALANIFNLTELWLSQNPRLKTIPDFSLFPHLKKLHLMRTPEVEDINIASLSSLEEINIRDNGHWGKLPNNFTRLSALSRADLSGINLVQIPPKFGLLTQLTLLDLHANKLTEISEEFSKLQNLTKLNIAKNTITSLQNLAKLTNLTSLKASSNKVDALKEEFFALVKLKELELSYNKIAHIIPSVENLTNLEVLEITNNYLMGLPPEFGKLVKLRKLLMDDNFLKMLPWELGFLKDTLIIYSFERNPDLMIPPNARSIGVLNWLRKNAKEGKKIEEKQIKKKEKELAKVWYCLMNKEWNAYSDSLCQLLELSYRNQAPSLTLTTISFIDNKTTNGNFTIDFVNMKQINNQTKLTRDICRGTPIQESKKTVEISAVWSYKNEYNEFVRFEQTFSDIIETKYLEYSESSIRLCNDAGEEFIFDFKSMKRTKLGFSSVELKRDLLFSWEYFDEVSGWKEYTRELQDDIETAWKADKTEITIQKNAMEVVISFSKSGISEREPSGLFRVVRRSPVSREMTQPQRAWGRRRLATNAVPPLISQMRATLPAPPERLPPAVPSPNVVRPVTVEGPRLRKENTILCINKWLFELDDDYVLLQSKPMMTRTPQKPNRLLPTFPDEQSLSTSTDSLTNSNPATPLSPSPHLRDSSPFVPRVATLDLPPFIPPIEELLNMNNMTIQRFIYMKITTKLPNTKPQTNHPTTNHPTSQETPQDSNLSLSDTPNTKARREMFLSKKTGTRDKNLRLETLVEDEVKVEDNRKMMLQRKNASFKKKSSRLLHENISHSVPIPIPIPALHMTTPSAVSPKNEYSPSPTAPGPVLSPSNNADEVVIPNDLWDMIEQHLSD